MRINHGRTWLSVGFCVAMGCSANTPGAGDEREGLTGNVPSEAISGEQVVEREPAEPEEPKLAPALPTLDGAYFSAFDLLVNRPLAHRVAYANGEATLVVDASQPDFVRYVHGGHAAEWMLSREVDEQVVAAVRAREASIWLPAVGPDADDVVRLRLYNPARWKNSLTVKLNGESLEPVALEQGWQSVEIATAGALKDENELTLGFSNLGRIDKKLSGGALASVEVGPARPAEVSGKEEAEIEGDEDTASGDSPGDESSTPQEDADVEAGGPEEQEVEAAQPSEADPEGVGGEGTLPLVDLPLDQGSLRLVADEAAAWYLWLVEGAGLEFELSGDPGCGVDVLVEGESSAGLERLVREERMLVEGRGEVQITGVDLGEHAGQVARVIVRAVSGCAEGVEVKRARLMRRGEAPALPSGVEPPQYIVFWMIDTLRADYLSLHGESDVRTPELQRLADEGAYFRLAYVQGNESKTSHASLFSGMYPNKHRVVGKGALRNHHRILPEALQDAGYRTGAHISNGYVSKPWGFVQGWDHYVNNLRDGWRIDGHSMAEHGIKWLKKHRDDRLFLYLGTIDPHVTYRRHEELIDRYDPEPYTGRFRAYLSGEELGRIKGGSMRVDGRDKARIIALYKNEIEFNDQALGKLRAALEEEGMWDKTMVVVTSDHGEEFWEHGSVGHGHNIHQELVHVPFLVYYPPLYPKGVVVEAGVDVLDMYPTLVEAVGGEVPDEVQGKSVHPLAHGLHGGYPEPAIATQYLIHYAMQMQDWKLYLRRGAFELYDRSVDPLEMKDVASAHPLASRWLLDAMGWFRAHRKRWDKRTWGVPSKLKPGFLELVEEE